MSVDAEQICVFSTQCAPPGCLIELCIQLSMIMLGKQLIQNNVFEVLIPYVHVYVYKCYANSCKLMSFTKLLKTICMTMYVAGS